MHATEGARVASKGCASPTGAGGFIRDGLRGIAAPIRRPKMLAVASHLAAPPARRRTNASRRRSPARPVHWIDPSEGWGFGRRGGANCPRLMGPLSDYVDLVLEWRRWLARGNSWGRNAIPCGTALPIGPASLALIPATMAKVVRAMQTPSTRGDFQMDTELRQQWCCNSG